VADIVVVGAGIVGASIAWHTARLGADVTIIDKGLPASGATGDSFGWVGAAGRVPGPGGALHAAAVREYRRLEDEVPGVRVRWSGSLAWGGAEPGGPLGPGQDLVDAEELLALEPDLRTPPAQAVHIPGDGAVDPRATTDALIAAARDRGARLTAGTAVTELRVVRGRVAGVETTGGFLASDAVVLTAGADVPVLCARLGSPVPVAPSPAVLLRLAGPAAVVRTIVATPDVEVRAHGDGELLATVPYTGQVTTAELARSAERGRDRIASMFHGGSDVRLLSARVGMRPMPVDGHPLIGPLPAARGAYLAVMHSGVTLAPGAGRLVAKELVNGTEAPELQGCRPS
jgi:glycine/D-amino acid oxidase-like deaminating enzyme